MSSGTCTILQPAGIPRIRIVKTDSDGKHVPAIRRFIYCWENEGGKWNAAGLFLSDSEGVLYNVEDDVRKEYSNAKGNGRNEPAFLLPNGPAASVPDAAKHVLFKPKSKAEYFFAFLPVDLLFRSEYTSNHKDVKAWADSNASLMNAPPQHWLDAPEYYGIKTRITLQIITNGLPVQKNWLEWLSELSNALGRMNWYAAYATARKQPYIQTAVFLDTISDMLEGTAKCADKIEVGSTAREHARDYAVYHLDSFSRRIRNKYLSAEVLQKEQHAFLRFAQQVLAIINDKAFRKAFLLYGLVDKKCDGSSAFSMQSQKTGKIEFDPVYFMLPERIDQILRAAFAAIIYDPRDLLVRQFYEQTILPVELKLGNTLEADELTAIKNIFDDPDFSRQFLSGCTAEQKKTLLAEIDSATKSLADSGVLKVLDLKVPGLQQQMENMDSENPIWNWLKDSPQESTDAFLEIFLNMRESWATDPLESSPRLQASMKDSIRRATLSLRIATASFKRYSSSAGGTPGKVITRSAKDYLDSVKKRMMNKDRWIMGENGIKFGSTPANLNMVFSAIGVVVSIQGIYSFAQKCRSGSKPAIDDYVDLYKSLSTGVSGCIGLMPDAISESKLIKALNRVFVPLSIGCDIYASIKLIKKSQLYFAHREIGKGLYSGIQAGIQLSAAGFNLASLFRWKGLTKILLRKEVLIEGAPKALGFTVSFAFMGCEAFAWYLKATEPDGQKIANKLIDQLDTLFSDKKLDTTKIEAHGFSFNVPKIDHRDGDLKWKDSPTFKGKEIYCDPQKEWDWLELRKFIIGELVGVPPLKGMGWVSEFDEEKAMFELLDRGVQVDAVGKICKMKKNEVEEKYKETFRKKFAKIDDENMNRIDKERSLTTLLS
jgi:hypothetical protein